ncbi:MAG: hypoxanthine phosphoribosyltransferase [Chloroflexi bacterium]|nr:hypoxanthine phosphoribosyltransferase [Chloroflexota bacterium]
MTTKEQTYYRAVRQTVSALAGAASLKEAFDVIVRRTSRAMKARASLMLLDFTGKKLAHVAYWGLPRAYVQKGMVDVDRSLAEVVTGAPVAIVDAASDARAQYPSLAGKFGIASILGVPVQLNGAAAGCIRIYTRQRQEFDHSDIDFALTMARLAAMAIELKPQRHAGEPVPAGPPLRQARSVTFAHPSEEEFVRILDFYNIEWVYEPRSFPLKWEGDRIVEMFTPDFYLPGLDLYVELTTLRQKLVTEKNRKLRRLRELYPDIKITLLYRKDFERLLAKYGVGALSQARGRGVQGVLYSSAEIQSRVRELAGAISQDYAGRHPVMVGVLRGVFCFLADLVRQMSIPVEIEFMAISYYGGNSSAVKITKDVDVSLAGRDVIMVEDIVDTGLTLNYMLNYLQAKDPSSLKVCTLLDKRARRIASVPLDYTGFKAPDEFVVGYGLDYRGEYRNLPFIGVLGPETSAGQERSQEEVASQ